MEYFLAFLTEIYIHNNFDLNTYLMYVFIYLMNDARNISVPCVNDATHDIDLIN